MYRELVLELSKGNEWVKVQPPCSEVVISEAEKVVGYSFPEELKNLLREMNGDKWLFLSAEAIIENVKLNREIFLPLFAEDYSKEACIHACKVWGEKRLISHIKSARETSPNPTYKIKDIYYIDYDEAIAEGDY